MNRDLKKIIIGIVICIIAFFLIKGIVVKDREKAMMGQESMTMNVRTKVDRFSELGNPEKYDKDRSLLRYAPAVFIIGGIWFVVQDGIRKLRKEDYSEYYRPFWKEEPFGGFHPEYEDEMGNVYGSDRADGRGLLGYRSYGNDKAKQQDLKYREEAVNAGYNPYQQQQQPQNQQPQQQPYQNQQQQPYQNQQQTYQDPNMQGQYGQQQPYPQQNYQDPNMQGQYGQQQGQYGQQPYPNQQQDQYQQSYDGQQPYNGQNPYNGQQ